MRYSQGSKSPWVSIPKVWASPDPRSYVSLLDWGQYGLKTQLSCRWVGEGHQRDIFLLLLPFLFLVGWRLRGVSWGVARGDIVIEDVKANTSE